MGRMEKNAKHPAHLRASSHGNFCEDVWQRRGLCIDHGLGQKYIVLAAVSLPNFSK